MKTRKTRVMDARGSVFEDLGASPHEAQNLLVRAQLMLKLRKVIRDRGLTQARAAKLFGVTQPRVSDLTRGKIDRFSVDTLMGMLWRAGFKARLTMQPKAA